MSDNQPRKKTSPLELTLAAAAAVAAVGVLGFQYYRVEIDGPGNRGPRAPLSFVFETDAGRKRPGGGGTVRPEWGEWWGADWGA